MLCVSVPLGMTTMPAARPPYSRRSVLRVLLARGVNERGVPGTRAFGFLGPGPAAGRRPRCVRQHAAAKVALDVMRLVRERPVVARLAQRIQHVRMG
jgi:hypothetical protein